MLVAAAREMEIHGRILAEPKLGKGRIRFHLHHASVLKKAARRVMTASPRTSIIRTVLMLALLYQSSRLRCRKAC